VHAGDCALKSGPFFSEERRGLRLALVPLDPAERAMILQAMRLSRGAAPAEVRIAFVGLRAWAQRELIAYARILP